MPGIWTSEKILSLAPDVASATAGKGLASTRKWVSLGRSERAIWGECQGSGAKPYQTRIDVTTARASSAMMASAASRGWRSFPAI